MHAHLLLAASAEYEFQDKWLGYINDWTQLNKALKDKTLLDRAADALDAAETDPAAYGKAETLYMDTVMKPLTKAFNACGAASRDEFVGKYYVTGTGSVEPAKERFRVSFEESMKEIWAEAKKPPSK